MLSLRSWAAEIHGEFYRILVFDFAVCFFETMDIIFQRFQKTFGMLGREYDAAFYFALGCAGHYIGKIDDELRMRMRDDDKV